MHLGQFIIAAHGARDPTAPSVWSVFWSVIDKIAAIITIIGLPYLVVRYRRRVPRFSFSFSSGNRQTYLNSDGHKYCLFSFSGTVKNESLDANSVERIHLVAWQNKRRRSTLRDGFGARITERGEAIEEPIRFDPREGKKLEISFDVPMENSVDTPLAEAVKTIHVSDRDWLIPKYDYELMFQDIEGRFFDNRGMLVNRKGIELRWTLGNRLAALKGGNPFPFAWQLSNIYVSDAFTTIRRMLRRFGV